MNDNPKGINPKPPLSPVLGWSGVGLATVLMMLISGLILYPETNLDHILIALRISSMTTAVPFVMVFAARAVIRINRELGRWLQQSYRYLWLILTISHLLHLYQIGLYYQQGQRCPWTVWGVTAPLWIIMVLLSGIALTNPQQFDALAHTHGNTLSRTVYCFSLWYIWLIFAIAFGLGSLTQHLLFFNVPALLLFLAAAILNAMTWLRQRAT